MQLHRSALKDGAGGDIDDLAVFLFAHDRDDSAGNLPHAPDVDPHDGIKFIDINLFKPPPRQLAEQGCIVDQPVDAAVLYRPSVTPYRQSGSFVGDVGDNAGRNPAISR